MRILCLGSGFTTGYLARRFAAEHEIFFLTRSADSLSPDFRLFDSTDPDSNIDCIIDSVPTLADSEEPAYHSVTRPLVRRGATYVHISTTSVYPGGGWPAENYSESTTPAPQQPGGQRRLQLEARIRASFQGAVLLRAGGIYGPGRNLAERFGNGDFSRLSTTDRLVSRIHVADLCRLCLALAPGGGPAIVNAVDPSPSWNSEVYAWLRSEMNIQFPAGFPLQLEQPPKARAIKSEHARNLLGEYEYPSFREGFRQAS